MFVVPLSAIMVRSDISVGENNELEMQGIEEHLKRLYADAEAVDKGMAGLYFKFGM